MQALSFLTSLTRDSWRDEARPSLTVFLLCITPGQDFVQLHIYLLCIMTRVAIFLNNYFIISNMSFKNLPSPTSTPACFPRVSPFYTGIVEGDKKKKKWEFHLRGQFGSIQKILMRTSCDLGTPFLSVCSREIVTRNISGC